MAIAAASPRHTPILAPPRIAPPVPAVSLVDDFIAEAARASITLMAWQLLGARYLTARAGTHWMYREVCEVVARQNGKTKLLVPHVRQRLKMRRRVIHTAQNRTLPRQVFMEVARSLDPHDIDTIRYANGQEHIQMRSGGAYMIVAPQRGARGLSGDDLIVDEVREFEDYDIIEAATPTLTASEDPQILYLSNAGSDVSVVLNDLKRRGESGDVDGLAYLEWSAAPDRAIDDQIGWAEANPALGHFPNMLRILEDRFRSLPAASFETEHLCRWVNSMQPKLVTAAAWELCKGTVGEPIAPSMAINMDPSGKRASAVMAWQRSDGRIACVELQEAVGDPIDVNVLGKDLAKLAGRHKARSTAFASWTDADLARNLLNAKALDGKEFANASENFVRLVQSGRLVWEDADHITADLGWIGRKPHESGAWIAVKTSEDRPVTAGLAAIRAVWLASAPKLSAPQVF